MLELRASRSRPGTGFVTLGVKVMSDRGSIVQEGRDTLMIAARGPAEPADGYLRGWPEEIRMDPAVVAKIDALAKSDPVIAKLWSRPTQP